MGISTGCHLIVCWRAMSRRTQEPSCYGPPWRRQPRSLPRRIAPLARIVALGVLVTVSLAAAAQRPVLLFDEAHDERNTIAWERALELDPDHPEFHSFVELAEALAPDYEIRRGLDSLDSASLSTADVVVISSPTTRFTATEVAAIVQFVQSGGGLLVAQDANPASSSGSNQLAIRFGLLFRSGALRSERGDWDAGSFRAVADPEHPITFSLDAFQMNWGSSIEWAGDLQPILESDEHTWQDSNGNGRRDASEPQGPLTVAVAGEVGDGRIVFIGDNAFQDSINGTNRSLFRTALAWLVGSRTTSMDIPEFTIDPDVTRDSVVQIGDGPQVLSTDIKFYPNTRRAKPGDTVYWTLNLGNLEGPFTIIPEMDNDYCGESPVRLYESELILPFRYGEANIHVPFVVVRDSTGTTRTIYSANVLAVLPDMVPRSRDTIDLPSPEDPTGDVLKAVHLMTVDHTLLATASADAYAQEQLASWREAGVNLVVLNFHWFTKREDTPVQIPIYAASPMPAFWVGTLSFDEVVKLTQMIHDAGLHVAWRYAMCGEGEYATMIRLAYAPSDADLYFLYQMQIKPLCAEIAELVGAELFGLDVENAAFSTNRQACDVLTQVRQVFSGAVFNCDVTSDAVAQSSAVDAQCDLVYISTGLAGYAPMEESMKAWTAENLRKAFSAQVRTELLPIIAEFDKPIIFETFAEYDTKHPAFQENAYTAMLDVVASTDAPICGVVLHAALLYWTYISDIFDTSPFGRPAEQIMTHYFVDVLGDQRSYSFNVGIAQPKPLAMIADFESYNAELDLSVGAFSGQAASTIDSDAHDGLRGLRVSFSSRNQEGEFAYYVLQKDFVSPQNWQGYSTLNFWMRNDANPTSLIVSVADADGDRFTSDLIIPYSANNSWHLYSVVLDELVQPDWMPDIGDRRIDLGHVVQIQILEKIFDERDHTTWYDTFYLGGPLLWP